jgi:hypothetical protein
MNITLELTVEETNVVLRCLGKHPFDEIAQLIGKIKMQGESQIQKLSEAAAAAETAAAKAEA